MRVAAIGECMIELSPRNHNQYHLAYGGDTLNTAIYLARLGLSVDYFTALGDDRFSTQMLDFWQAEGVGTGHVIRLPGRLPGLYLIETDPKGERQFYYWRQNAPARELFALPETAKIIDALVTYDLIYLSGITLSLYGEAGRAVLIDGLIRARKHGGKVVFDSNYRPRGWSSPHEARHAMADILPFVDIALMGMDDEHLLYGAKDPNDIVRRLSAFGIDEIVIKQAGEGATVAGHDFMIQVPVETVQNPVDTTGAGDSFNAAYLSAYIRGINAEEAVKAGNLLAAEVILHPGAIIPLEAMPKINLMES